MLASVKTSGMVTVRLVFSSHFEQRLHVGLGLGEFLPCCHEVHSILSDVVEHLAALLSEQDKVGLDLGEFGVHVPERLSLNRVRSQRLIKGSVDHHGPLAQLLTHVVSSGGSSSR